MQHDVLPSHSSAFLYQHLHQYLKLLPCLSPWRFLNSRPICLFWVTFLKLRDIKQSLCCVYRFCGSGIWSGCSKVLFLLHNVWHFRWEESKIKGLDDSKAWDWNYLGVLSLPCPVLGWMTEVWAPLKMSIRGLTHSLSMGLGLQYACVYLATTWYKTCCLDQSNETSYRTKGQSKYSSKQNRRCFVCYDLQLEVVPSTTLCWSKQS